MTLSDDPCAMPSGAPEGDPGPASRWKQLPLGLMNEYRVQFEIFEGPLDLLLHLVKKQEVDIYQINLSRIASEFVAYIDQMRDLDLEVAGEFLVMAATLVYIKSRELLPADQKPEPQEGDEEEDDPRFELIRRLVEYKKFKDAASVLQGREETMGLVYEHRAGRPDFAGPETPRREAVSVFELIQAVSAILKRFHDRDDVREIQADPYTVSEKMEHLRTLIHARGSFRFGELFADARTRGEVVVTFLAMLELTRLRQIEIRQGDDFGEIEVSVAPPEAVATAGAGVPAGPDAAADAEEEAGNTPPET
jgi:segregation and condensation protein A